MNKQLIRIFGAYVVAIVVTSVSMVLIEKIVKPHKDILDGVIVAPSVLPDPLFTPGVANPDVTQENIFSTICNPHWSTKSIRPPSSYTSNLKKNQLQLIGYTDQDPTHYEEDHLISLELGGSPTDPNNLWPESYLTVPGAREKDKIENFLHKEVCLGTIQLSNAQKIISTDWVSEYYDLNGQNLKGVSDTDE